MRGAKKIVQGLKITMVLLFIISAFGLYYIGSKGDAETTLTMTTSTFVVRTQYPEWYYPQITIILVIFFVSVIFGGLLFVGFGDDIENFIKQKVKATEEAQGVESR